MSEIMTILIYFHQSHYRTFKESVIDQLKNVSQIEHTRHRTPINCFVNIIAGLIAYCRQPKKPSLNIIPNGTPLLAA